MATAKLTPAEQATADLELLNRLAHAAWDRCELRLVDEIVALRERLERFHDVATQAARVCENTDSLDAWTELIDALDSLGLRDVEASDAEPNT